MIYVERFRKLNIFKTEEELGVTAFILSDFFLNDRHYTKAFMQQNGFIIDSLDERICQTLSNPAVDLYVTSQ